MSQRRWQRAPFSFYGSQLLSTTRIAWVVLLGVLVFGQCLSYKLQVFHHASTAAGCHDDCWYQRPDGQPIAALPPVPLVSRPQLDPSDGTPLTPLVIIPTPRWRSPTLRSPPMAS